MSKKQGTNYSELIVFAAAIVTVVRYAAAFVASDTGLITGWLSEAITLLLGISGMGMGILDTFGGMYIFDGWRKVMPANGKPWPFRFKILTVFIFALMSSGVMILVPFTMSRVLHVSMADVLNTTGKLEWWSFLVNVTPYLLIGGVAVGNKMVNTETQAETFQKVSAEPSAPEGWKKIKKSITPDQLLWLTKARTDDICVKYNVIPRTATNYRKNAQEELQRQKGK